MKTEKNAMLFGGCIILISILTIIYGAQRYPFDWGNIDFMSFFIGGMLGAALGLYIIGKNNFLLKKILIVFGAVLIAWYCYIVQMNWMLLLMSWVVIFTMTLWLIGKVGAKSKPIIRVCRKCSGVNIESINHFAEQNGYFVKVGCVGHCQNNRKDNSEVFVRRNKELIVAENESSLLEKMMKC
ncbi:MAG: hypothetical protein Q4D65_09905 [Peptostreptococcaceae bacterium]|nr:hypothetical protein [Peptostreptococcaceae bacterium]